MENRLYPLRELYAELLLETGQPAAALNEFETALEQTPNRYRTFLGIARAANAAGDRQKASEYYGKLVDLAKNADTERPETREARAIPRAASEQGAVAGNMADAAPAQPSIVGATMIRWIALASSAGCAGRRSWAIRGQRRQVAKLIAAWLGASERSA